MSSSVRSASDPGNVTVLIRGSAGRLRDAAARRVHEDQRGQEPGDAGAEDGDRDAGDDVVDAEGDGREGEQETAERAADDADDHPPPRPELVRAPGAEPGAEDQLTLQADVHHAGPLGPQAAEAGQPDRHRQPQRRAGGAAGGDVVGAGDQPDDRDQHEHAGDAEQPERPTDTPAASLRRRGLGHRLDEAGGGHAGLPSPVPERRPPRAARRRPGAAAAPARTGAPARTR